MYVPLSTAGSPRGNPSHWGVLRAQNLDLGQAPGWGWRVGDSLPPTPARGYNSWQKWNGRQGVVGVGEIMEGLPLGLGFTSSNAQSNNTSEDDGSQGGFSPMAVVGTALSVAGSIVGAFIARNQKHNAQKVAATNAVNQLIQALQQNLAAYQASNHYVSEQQQALGTFDAGWQWLVSINGCGNADLGSAGDRCISERQRGGIYDMWKDLRDPIANDPQVKPDPVAGGPVDGSGTSTVIGPDGTVQQVPTTGGGLLGGGNGGVLLLAAAALAVVAFMGDK